MPNRPRTTHPTPPGGRGFFVTGTDTGVGKTLIAAGLARLLRARGLNVGVMKPVATGCGVRSGRRFSPDARLLAASAESRDDPALVTPYLLRAPLAPWIAAAQEGVSIDLGGIESAYRELSHRHDITVIEGVGGLLVPLSGRETVADLIGRLGLPVLVVAANRLGTLNHTLLTIREAERAGLEVLGVILNQTRRRADFSARTNASVLKSAMDVPLLADVPYLGAGKGSRGNSGRWGALMEHLDKGLHHLGIELAS